MRHPYARRAAVFVVHPEDSIHDLSGHFGALPLAVFVGAANEALLPCFRLPVPDALGSFILLAGLNGVKARVAPVRFSGRGRGVCVAVPAHRSSPDPWITPRAWRSASLSRFPWATSAMLRSNSVQSVAIYQSTSPISFLRAWRRLRVIIPASSRSIFLICSQTSPASPARPSAG